MPEPHTTAGTAGAVAATGIGALAVADLLQQWSWIIAGACIGASAMHWFGVRLTPWRAVMRFAVSVSVSVGVTWGLSELLISAVLNRIQTSPIDPQSVFLLVALVVAWSPQRALDAALKRAGS